MKVFIDTGGWISVLVKNDIYHNAGKIFYQSLLEKNIPLATSNYVLDETITRIRYDAGHTKAVEFCDLIRGAIEKGLLELFWIDELIVVSAEDLFKQYQDQKLSFTDCTTIALIKEKKIKEIFAFDRHFTTFGFQVRP